MTFLCLNSDKMGEGDQELGKKLLVSFLKNLAKSDIQIDIIGCVNSGVFLTTAENPALKHLRTLEEKGAQIASCITCLEHYNLKNNLLIGGIGTMEQSVQMMATADRVIKP
ncbi:MAG: sulfurtransferase-like selenium metabolism protein YedF [Candidatus Marinimicrobia bacterium]|nr:sulfurtransferase-like selenium metabolism protein YedF [Candidatus Neomarinimicrobiota bacterium]